MCVSSTPNWRLITILSIDVFTEESYVIDANTSEVQPMDRTNKTLVSCTFLLLHLLICFLSSLSLVFVASVKNIMGNGDPGTPTLGRNPRRKLHSPPISGPESWCTPGHQSILKLNDFILLEKLKHLDNTLEITSAFYPFQNTCMHSSRTVAREGYPDNILIISMSHWNFS